MPHPSHGRTIVRRDWGGDLTRRHAKKGTQDATTPTLRLPEFLCLKTNVYWIYVRSWIGFGRYSTVPGIWFQMTQIAVEKLFFAEPAATTTLGIF
ncbi:hypothetical protein [Asticcacaulis excentricus]|uniref:hypothetical protein n=1 Tax=Asticcacaulis excentricus TaxID=78587 RepID=UPI00117D0557|nr:hypothetical protein [Asticcacaulis excentricus]